MPPLTHMNRVIKVRTMEPKNAKYVSRSSRPSAAPWRIRYPETPCMKTSENIQRKNTSMTKHHIMDTAQLLKLLSMVASARKTFNKRKARKTFASFRRRTTLTPARFPSMLTWPATPSSVSASETVTTMKSKMFHFISAFTKNQRRCTASRRSSSKLKKAMMDHSSTSKARGLVSPRFRISQFVVMATHAELTMMMSEQNDPKAREDSIQLRQPDRGGSCSCAHHSAHSIITFRTDCTSLSLVFDSCRKRRPNLASSSSTSVPR
mmetsp:Transcript_89782/g.249376  ORF Transcript_89782/g.249376 Transcript_89782/m.249376 type:complete len:264 (+) Transcript_89782:348-1139(+)